MHLMIIFRLLKSQVGGGRGSIILVLPPWEEMLAEFQKCLAFGSLVIVLLICHAIICPGVCHSQSPVDCSSQTTPLLVQLSFGFQSVCFILLYFLKWHGTLYLPALPGSGLPSSPTGLLYLFS